MADPGDYESLNDYLAQQASKDTLLLLHMARLTTVNLTIGVCL